MQSLSYTGRDNEDIRQSLIDLVPQLTDQWRDFNESDLGITIIELIAGAQDMQNFYLDNQTFETYIDTAMQDKNIRAILRAMNYRVPLMVSAIGMIRVEFMTPLEAGITFPLYTQFKCSEVRDVTYVSTKQVSALVGSEYVDIPIMEGELKTIQVTKNELAKNITSTGKVSRRIYLNDNSVADKSVKMVQNGIADGGTFWEEVDDALLKYWGGRYYSVHKDATGNVYLLMSVNFMDLLPADADEPITITYIKTRGTKGLVNAYQIDTLLNLSEYNSLIYKVYNIEATSGAADEPNLQYAKLLARAHAQTMGRYVTLEDYANGIAINPTIMYSVVKDWKTTDLVNYPFTVFVWAVNLQGNNLSVLEQNNLIAPFRERGITAVGVEYQKTEFVYFDVSVVVYLKPVTEAERDRLLGAVEQYLVETFSPENIDYGDRVSISILTSSIYTLSPYFKSVVIETPDKDVESTEIQLLRLRNVSVRAEED